MFPYGHNGAFVSLPLRNSYLFGSISYSTFLILFNSGFIVPCFGLALPLTVRVFLWAGIKITKFSIYTKSEYANKRVLWLSTPLIEIPCYMLCFLSESSLFVVVGVGKFILFLALAKRGKGNALFVFLLVKA